MYKMKAKWIGKLGLGLLLVATSVLAQPAPRDEAVEGELNFRKGGQLTSQEQLSQADSYINKMRAILARMDKLAEMARKDRDIIKLNCVNDKLIQVKGNLNLGEQARESLKVAAARNDDGTRNHEFAKLTIIYQKVTVLGQEAEACIGEEISYVGKTRVEIEVDKDIPQEDPTVIPPPPPPVERPTVVSPIY